MHQLADALVRRGYRAVLIPMRNFRGRSPDPEYSIYSYEVRDRIAERDRAVLVLGEVSPIESHRELKHIPANRTWLWWLSVHNGPDPRSRYFRGSATCCTFESRPSGTPQDRPDEINQVGKAVRKTPYADASTPGLWRESWRRTVADYSPGKNPRTFGTEFISLLYNRRIIESEVGFLAQSVYAQGFCRSILGRSPLPMTDYLRRPTIANTPLMANVVLYNGAKGYSMIRELAPLMPEIDFRPIERMSYLEVCEALSGAAAYIELGVPPGRDRLPRESAHFGTPVVLLCRGSAYCWDDFPLPNRFRIPFVSNWPTLMAPILRDVVADRRGALVAQEQFRAWVAGDRQRFEDEVDAWLVQVLANA